eukprot:291380-Chlamydomonas_euryale.AAC.1
MQAHARRALARQAHARRALATRAHDRQTMQARGRTAPVCPQSCAPSRAWQRGSVRSGFGAGRQATGERGSPPAPVRGCGGRVEGRHRGRARREGRGRAWGEEEGRCG